MVETEDAWQTMPGVWHKLPIGELKIGQWLCHLSYIMLLFYQNLK